MSLLETANALAEACRTGGERAALETLYADDAVSVEAMDQGNGREAHGKDAIRGKHDWWEAEMDVLEATVGGPHLHGPDRFALTFEVKAKQKSDGSVHEMSEVGIYTVADGKIIREEFFYGAG